MSFYKEVPDRKTTLESTLKFDTTPTAGSTNPVTSDGVKNAIDSAVGDASADLQEQIDEIAEKAGSGYIPKGEATVATLNGLSGQENGELYTMTDAGTLTDGSLAVVAGDTVAWDATNSKWYKAMDYAPAQYGTNEVHNLSTTITAFRTGDVIPVDGPSGTAKMGKDALLRVTAENAVNGVYNSGNAERINGGVVLEYGSFTNGKKSASVTTRARFSAALVPPFSISLNAGYIVFSVQKCNNSGFVSNSSPAVQDYSVTTNDGMRYCIVVKKTDDTAIDDLSAVVASFDYTPMCSLLEALVQTDKNESIYFLNKSVTGKVDYLTGNVGASADYFCETIDVSGYKCLSCQMPFYAGGSGVAFFDENDNYIVGYTGYSVEMVITLRVPENAKYMKYSYYTDSAADTLSRSKSYSVKFYKNVVPYIGARNATDGTVYNGSVYYGTTVGNCLQSLEHDVPEGANFVNCSVIKTGSGVPVGPVFFDENWNFVEGFKNYTIDSNEDICLPVPNGAKHFIYTYWNDFILSQVPSINPPKKVQFIFDTTHKVFFDAEKNGSVGGVNYTTGAINSSVTNNFVYDFEIPENYNSVNFQVFKTTQGYGVAFLDADKNFIVGYVNSVLDSGSLVSRAIPVGAKYFRYSYVNASVADLNNFPRFSGVTFEKTYMALPTSKRHSFSVNVNVTLRTPDDTETESVEDSYVEDVDYGFIQLPSNYSADGNPVRLVITCHGAGASRDTYKSEDYFNFSQTYWNNLGFAIFDMFAAPQAITGNSENHYGNPAVLQCYKKGFDYVMKHFNVFHDGVVVVGSSMGGLSSFQIVDSGMFPVICQVANCPCIDLYKQAYCNPWTTVTYQREKIASYFNFEGTVPTFTSSKPPSQDEKDYFIDNFKNTIGFYPILKNVVSGDIASVLSYVPSNITTESDATEEALYSALTATHKVPIIVFHCKNDGVVAWRYSKYWVDMIRRSGQLVYFHSFPSGGHSAWEAGDSTSVVDVDGNTISLPAAKYEAYLFVKRFTD